MLGYQGSIRILVGLGVLVFLSACGKGNWVQDARLRSYVEGGDQYGEVIARVQSGQMQLPSLEIPIVRPQQPGVIFGRVAVRGGVGGASDVSIALNLTRVAKLPTGSSDLTLPNGSPLPVAGVDPSKTLSFQLGDGHSKVYVNMSPESGTAMVGTALVIPQFNVGIPAEIFLPFVSSDGKVHGLAGVFTGALPMTSGFGLFADISGLLQQSLTQSLAAPAGGNVVFVPGDPSPGDRQKVARMLERLNAKRARINIR